MELVEVGDEHLVGEVIGLNGDMTSPSRSMKKPQACGPGRRCLRTGLPLSVELGPGLLRSIFDGIQRPLPVIEMRSGSFISRGLHLTPLYRKDRWSFHPHGQSRAIEVSGGAILGTVPETHIAGTPRDGPAGYVRDAHLGCPSAKNTPLTNRSPGCKTEQRRREIDHAAALAGAPAAPLPDRGWESRAADHRAARAGHLLPAGQRRRRRHPGRVWLRQDRHPAHHRQMGRCRR